MQYDKITFLMGGFAKKYILLLNLEKLYCLIGLSNDNMIGNKYEKE